MSMFFYLWTAVLVFILFKLQAYMHTPFLGVDVTKEMRTPKTQS